MPPVLGVGAYVIGRAGGWQHPEVLGLAAIVAGLLIASAVRGVLRAETRKGGAMSAGRHGGPVYQVLPEAAPEVLILVEQDRKIQAIKRYRELNPGIGLKQAKDVIDGL
jgi:ribosomal protein L7/L12